MIDMTLSYDSIDFIRVTENLTNADCRNKTASGWLCEEKLFILYSANDSYVSVSVSAAYGKCLLVFTCVTGLRYLREGGKGIVLM